MYEDKVSYLKENDWFYMNGSWHHPFLAKSLDLDSAYLYERFKRADDEENLHDDDFGG